MLVPNDEWHKTWSTIKKCMEDCAYSGAVTEAGKMLEWVLRRIILQSSSNLPFEKRAALLRLEEQIIRDKKPRRTEGVDGFALGDLTRIVEAKDVGFIEAISQSLEKDAQILRSINFGSLTALRNRCQHRDYVPTRSEAQYFVSNLEILFSLFNIQIVDYSSVLQELQCVKEENQKLLQEQGRIEAYNSVVSFYQKYSEIQADMNYRDTCYYTEYNPLTNLIPELKAIYEKTHYSNLRSDSSSRACSHSSHFGRFISANTRAATVAGATRRPTASSRIASADPGASVRTGSSLDSPRVLRRCEGRLRGKLRNAS